MGSPFRDLVTYPCEDACGEIETAARVEGAPVYRCPGCDSEWILLNERTPRKDAMPPDALPAEQTPSPDAPPPDAPPPDAPPAVAPPAGAPPADGTSAHDARALLDRAERILFVHAHPDDETIATGALIAHLARAGKRVAVLTATRGELGEIVPGSVPPGMDADALAAHREGELEAACRTLGVAEGAFLGTPPARAPGRPERRYTDGGMTWLDEAETVAGSGSDAGPDALVLADPIEVTADITAYARHVAAEVLISYDAEGGYGHPDHVVVHHATRAAAAQAGVPFVEQVSRPEGEATYDLPDAAAVVADALRRHASQVTVEGTDLVHVGGQRQPILLAATLRVPA